MTDAERAADSNRYWIMNHGMPYLVVEEKDDSIFANDERQAAVVAATSSLNESHSVNHESM